MIYDGIYKLLKMVIQHFKKDRIKKKHFKKDRSITYLKSFANCTLNLGQQLA